MDRTRPTVNQLNIVSSNPEASIAFYRRLGLDIPDRQVWGTATGVHHVSAEDAGIRGTSISTARLSRSAGTADGAAARTSPAAWSWVCTSPRARKSTGSTAR